jgi:hypothetical protein
VGLAAESVRAAGAVSGCTPFTKSVNRCWRLAPVDLPLVDDAI